MSIGDHPLFLSCLSGGLTLIPPQVFIHIEAFDLNHFIVNEISAQQQNEPAQLQPEPDPVKRVNSKSQADNLK
jgi:hypothetical protein